MWRGHIRLPEEIGGEQEAGTNGGGEMTYSNDYELQSVYDRGFETGYAAPASQAPRQRPEGEGLRDIDYAAECGFVDGQNQLLEDMQRETL